MKIFVVLIFAFIGNICSAEMTEIVCDGPYMPRGEKKFSISDDMKILKESNENILNGKDDKLGIYLRSQGVNTNFEGQIYKNSKINGSVYFYESIHPVNWDWFRFKISLDTKNGEMNYTIIFPAISTPEKDNTINNKLQFKNRKPSLVENKSNYKCY